MLHSGRSGTLLHLLSPAPSNASCIHALLGRGVRFLPRCNSSFRPYDCCSVLKSCQFTPIKLFFKLQIDWWNDAPWFWFVRSLWLSVTTFQKASCLNIKRPHHLRPLWFVFSTFRVTRFNWNSFIGTWDKSFPGSKQCSVFFCRLLLMLFAFAWHTFQPLFVVSDPKDGNIKSCFTC